MGQIETEIDISTKDVEVLTDVGFIKINSILKIKPLKKYTILFESGRTLDCAENHKIINIEDREVFAEDLDIGEMIKSDSCLGFDVVFDVFESGKDCMFDIEMKDHHKYFTNGVLSHNSNMLANIAARQVLHGKNVVLMTLEMSQDAFAQRFDSIYSLLDINRIYISERHRKELPKALKKVKDTKGRGELFIKQFPTGEASVRDFKRYIRELLIRDIEPDILMVDYINLMKAATRAGSNMYESVKRIAEELRSLSFEFDVPVLSVSQLNREGSFVGFEDLDFNYIAESWGIPGVSDFMFIMGTNEDDMVYESEIHSKIVKNRLGKMGDYHKMYMDMRSLKMYDEIELDEFIKDATRSGDDRNLHESQ